MTFLPTSTFRLRPFLSGQELGLDGVVDAGCWMLDCRGQARGRMQSLVMRDSGLGKSGGMPEGSDRLAAFDAVKAEKKWRRSRPSVTTARSRPKCCVGGQTIVSKTTTISWHVLNEWASRRDRGRETVPR